MKKFSSLQLNFNTGNDAIDSEVSDNLLSTIKMKTSNLKYIFLYYCVFQMPVNIGKIAQDVFEYNNKSIKRRD